MVHVTSNASLGSGSELPIALTKGAHSLESDLAQTIHTRKLSMDNMSSPMYAFVIHTHDFGHTRIDVSRGTSFYV